MDVTASATGLVALAAFIIKSGYSLYSNWKDFPDDLQAILQQVSALHGVLDVLGPVIQNLEMSAEMLELKSDFPTGLLIPNSDRRARCNKASIY